MKVHAKRLLLLAIMILLVTGMIFAGAAKEVPAGEEEIVIYMQMGGVQGDGATLARTNGARAAASALGNVKLIEQYSQWRAETMIAQFKEAMAGNPTGIVIMGHPGDAAFMPLVEEARAMGILVTSGNAPLFDIEEKFQPDGFGYAGVDLYAGGYMTGQQMVRLGNLKQGDKAVVYGLFSQPGRRDSPTGMFDALVDAGLKVDKLEISPEVDSDSSLGIPILTAYMERNPDTKAIGTQHGAVTAIIPQALQTIGKDPGEVVVGGIDLAPATIEWIERGYITASLDQVLYLQGYIPVSQIVMTHRYKIPGLSINTASGVVTPENIEELKPLIEKGIR
ncbi:MAG: substrate-binding domain-containing protein [Spirochaetia bacterium]|nr:substrate-binding domain-containing protein [Spirochaetia bacterium]